jgi:hypothetical protein
MKSYHDRERARLWALLGELPRLASPPAVISRETLPADGYRLDRIVLDLNGIEPVPALWVRPPEGDRPFPTVLYNHAHGGDYELGKRELTDGRGALSDPPYARVLAERGWASLAIDHWAFGERQGHGEQHIFANMLWEGRVMWGMMLYDSIRAHDYLESRDDVDASRIGTIGISMGSTMGWWLAALDERVAVCVDICCLTEFHTFAKTPARRARGPAHPAGGARHRGPRPAEGVRGSGRRRALAALPLPGRPRRERRDARRSARVARPVAVVEAPADTGDRAASLASPSRHRYGGFRLARPSSMMQAAVS